MIVSDINEIIKEIVVKTLAVFLRKWTGIFIY